MKKKSIIAIGMAGLVALYISAPVVVGAKRIGEREGPVLYPEGFHTVLYIFGHENSFNEKPRQRLDYWMYKRPLFYGMPRRLKTKAEREAYIQMAKNNESPKLDWLIEMNEKANYAVEATARKLAEPQR